MEGCLTIPLDFFPLTSSSVRVGFYAVMKLPILGNDLSVKFKEAGPAAPPLPPLPPPPDATVGLGVLSAGGRNGSLLLLARPIGCHRAHTCHFVARIRGSSHCVLRCLPV